MAAVATMTVTVADRDRDLTVTQLSNQTDLEAHCSNAPPYSMPTSFPASSSPHSDLPTHPTINHQPINNHQLSTSSFIQLISSVSSRSLILRVEAAINQLYYSISCWSILPSHRFSHPAFLFHSSATRALALHHPSAIISTSHAHPLQTSHPLYPLSRYFAHLLHLIHYFWAIL